VHGYLCCVVSKGKIQDKDTSTDEVQNRIEENKNNKDAAKDMMSVSCEVEDSATGRSLV
jgi:hypothetical protein